MGIKNFMNIYCIWRLQYLWEQLIAGRKNTLQKF